MTTMQMTDSYPDCPTCEKPVESVKHEAIDEDRRFSTDWTIHTKGSPFVLQPCGHEMYGCLLAEDLKGCRITEWYLTAEHESISHAMRVR